MCVRVCLGVLAIFVYNATRRVVDIGRHKNATNKEASHLWNFNFNHFRENYYVLKYARKKKMISIILCELLSSFHLFSYYSRCVLLRLVLCFTTVERFIYRWVCDDDCAQWFIVSYALWYVPSMMHNLNKSLCMRNICKGEH